MKPWLNEPTARTSLADFVQRNWTSLLLFTASFAFFILMWMFNWVDAKITISLLVLVFNLLAVRFIKFEHDIRSNINAVRTDIANMHIVDTVDERKFFQHMMAATISAERSIDVTRLDQTNPGELHLQEIRDYHKTAIETVRKRRIQFRRIVRIGTPSALEWVIETLEQLGDCPNFAIACLRESDTTTFSIHIFDRKELLFHMLSSGGVRPGFSRHYLHVRGNILAEAVSDYYDRVWKDAIPIKEGNIVNWSNLIRIAERLLARASRQNDNITVQRLSISVNKLNELSTKRG